MELTKTRKWLILSTSTWLVATLSLGSWWLYLVIKLAKTLEQHNIAYQKNLYNMLKWEGIFFFALLMILTFTVIALFYRDLKRSQSIQAFFASLTHELKTPLSNVRLQTEILREHLYEDSPQVIQKNLDRLSKGSSDLEQEFDKMLQLSRIERQGNLNISSINLKRYLANHKKSLKDLEIKIEFAGTSSDALVDEYALKIILNNLIQNSLKHNKNQNLRIDIVVKSKGQFLSLNYSETPRQEFTGEIHKLGQIFYKHNSHLGSGIGLYLVKNLMKQMRGEFIIHKTKENCLLFELLFQKATS